MVSIKTRIASVCFLLLPLTSGAGENGLSQFKEEIIVETQKSHIFIKMVFDNQTADAVFVPKSIAAAKALSNAFFVIKTTNGENIDYIGFMVKRAPLDADDYVAIEPHSKRENTLDITNSYAFKNGTHNYTLSHEGYYLNDLMHLDQLSTTNVVQANFAFTK